MRQGFWFCSLVVILHVVAVFPAAFSGQASPGGRQPEITIRVYDYAGIPQQTLAAAKTRIARILSHAGVMTSWIECSTSSAAPEDSAACRERMPPSELAIMIFHELELPYGVRRDTQLGYAEVFSNRQPGHYIFLSYDHIRDSASVGGFCPPETLAEVAAHEIGHVLFRSSDHSPAGLMRTRWDRKDFQNAAIGNLLFTPRQAEIIRADVAARMKEAETETATLKGNGSTSVSETAGFCRRR